MSDLSKLTTDELLVIAMELDIAVKIFPRSGHVDCVTGEPLDMLAKSAVATDGKIEAALSEVLMELSSGINKIDLAMSPTYRAFLEREKKAEAEQERKEQEYYNRYMGIGRINCSRL